jgi:hypothetical protein
VPAISLLSVGNQAIRATGNVGVRGNVPPEWRPSRSLITRGEVKSRRRAPRIPFHGRNRKSADLGHGRFPCSKRKTRGSPCPLILNDERHISFVELSLWHRGLGPIRPDPVTRQESSCWQLRGWGGVDGTRGRLIASFLSSLPFSRMRGRFRVGGRRRKLPTIFPRKLFQFALSTGLAVDFILPTSAPSPSPRPDPIQLLLPRRRLSRFDRFTPNGLVPYARDKYLQPTRVFGPGIPSSSLKTREPK